ncbi:MAG: 50S ribosomal protein L10, partial [Candidatus Fermentibacteraceae bacterium]|nr:50S ribosomal protein L10 [Candidatus Fermentibacteraceae bacterium]
MAISREQKEKVVTTLVEDLSGAGSVVFADFTGVNVEDMTELRRDMREQNVTFTIVKNTLLKRVFNNLEIDESEG